MGGQQEPARHGPAGFHIDGEAALMDTAHQPHIPAESGAAIPACFVAGPMQGH
jgi:hypothetical protein